MAVSLDLPDDLEKALIREAAGLGVSLSDYLLRILADRRLLAAPTARSGAELVAFWESEGLIGSRADIEDPVQYARELRERSQAGAAGNDPAIPPTSTLPPAPFTSYLRDPDPRPEDRCRESSPRSRRPTMTTTDTPSSSNVVITPQTLLEHWQGHRGLTRRIIEQFPEDQLFTFTLGGMRSFGELANEFLSMAVPSVRGMITGEWTGPEGKPTTKAEILQAWDADTAELNRLWPQLAPNAFQENYNAFGMYEGTGIWLLLYVIDNEVHHRGQGYVYLRALGIEPAPFWER